MVENEGLGARKPVLSDKRRAEALLLCVTVVWGLTFSLTKQSLTEIQPFTFMAWRFWIAVLVMGALTARKFHRIDRGIVKAGLILGCLLFGAYATQTFGLKYTTAGNAGFITGLFIVFTPALAFLVNRHVPDVKTIVAVVVALAGLAVLSLQPGTGVNSGDALVLACAFTYSIHIILLDKYVDRFDIGLLTFVQMGVLALANTASAAAFERMVLPPSAYVWMSVLVCGLFASAAAFYIQGYAQRILTPVRTSMVLIMEPVFSVLFGILLLSERLSWRGWLGCGLIFAGMLLAEARPGLLFRRKTVT